MSHAEHHTHEHKEEKPVDSHHITDHIEHTGGENSSLEVDHTRVASAGKIVKLIPLGTPGENRTSFSQAVSGLMGTVGKTVTDVVDMGKTISENIILVGKDIKEVPSISGKIAYTLSSVLKVPLDIVYESLIMLVKQGMNIGDAIAHMTSWEKIPKPVANFIRAPFAALGWVLGSSNSKNTKHPPHSKEHEIAHAH